MEFDTNHLNREITISLPEEWNDYRIHSPVSVFVQLNTNNATGSVTFPNNFAARIFIKQNNQWVEIKEQDVTRPPDKRVLSDSFHSDGAMFFPEFPDRTKEYDVRIYVFGDMKTQDGIKQVGAYVDFRLKP